MGETVTYLGHISVVPSLNQSEYDYLQDCFGLRPRESSGRAEGPPDDWCGWGPCPHGCCLSWDGREKFHSGRVWMEYLIDDLLRPGARAARRRDPRRHGFTFDHRLDGLVVGERSWSRTLFAIRVEDNEVSEEILRPGEPLAWEPGWDGLDLENRPWLAREPHPRRSSLDDAPPELSESDVISLVPPKPSRSRGRSAGRAAGRAAKAPTRRPPVKSEAASGPEVEHFPP